jgi:hypothetical protein
LILLVLRSASDPTVSRLIARLAEDPERAQGRSVRRARRHGSGVWRRAGCPQQAGQTILDLDATLVTAHSDKEAAAPTWKGGFGSHPLLGYVDHSDGGTGEPVAELLRPGNAGSNTAADHILALEQALAQIPSSNGNPTTRATSRCWSAPTPLGGRGHRPGRPVGLAARNTADPA